MGGQVYKGARVGGPRSLRGLCTCAEVHASPRQFLRGAISFVIYFAGGNSCFRNAIRAWPLPPRLANVGREAAYDDDNDNDDEDVENVEDDVYDDDENGSGGSLEIAALIRIRRTNEIIRK